MCGERMARTMSEGNDGMLTKMMIALEEHIHLSPFQTAA